MKKYLKFRIIFLVFVLLIGISVSASPITPLVSNKVQATSMYVDSDTGLNFIIPDNWRQEELSEERDVLDAKFISTVDGIHMIAYGSYDVLEELPASEKIKYNREDFSNLNISKSDIAEMYDVEEDKISIVEYNGIEYFQIIKYMSGEIYGENITVETTQLIHVNNGWIYMFLIDVTEESEHFKDFQKMLNSVRIPSDSNVNGGSSAGILDSTYSESNSAEGESVSSFSKSLIIGFLATIFVYMLCPFIIILTRKKFSKKALRRIASVNGIIGFIVFTIFKLIIGEGQIAKVHVALLWSSITYSILLKTSLKKEHELMISEKNELRFCRKCGNRLINDSEFCRQCGTVIVKE